MSGRRGDKPGTRWMRIAQYVLLAVGASALGYCATAWISATLYQASRASQFARQLRSKHAVPLTLPSPPANAVARDGGLIGRLEIPRLGLSVMIVEGVGEGDLKRAVGHIPGTALPGRSGNSAIAGHRDTFFRPLRLIRPNDAIVLSTLDGTYRYRVVFTTVVAPDDVRVLKPTGRDSLTLVTCFPFYFIGSAPERFIVRAVRG